jgi:diadenosine tetraphosphate (Ap4A) HIT family hydrolase
MFGSDPADCPFCRLMAGELDPGVHLPISDGWAAFPALHQRPSHRGHTLLAPTRHLSTLEELTEAMAGPLLRDLKQVTAAVKQAFVATGVSVRFNLGPPGQSVAHLHFHLIPRYLGDHLDFEEPVLVPLQERLAQRAQLARVLLSTTDSGSATRPGPPAG